MVSSTHERGEERVPSCGWNTGRKLDNVNFLSVRWENNINLVRTFGMRLRTGIILLKIGPIGEVL